MNTISCPNKLKGDCSTNMMILDCDLLYYRYAQAVMLDAELKYWRKDYEGAVKSLNLIAKRAYGVDNFYTEATKEAVLDALCTETLLEFPCEGVVWWTLHPTGQDLGLQSLAGRAPRAEPQHPVVAHFGVGAQQEHQAHADRGLELIR